MFGSAHRQTFDRAMGGLLPKLQIRTELTHNEAIKNAVKSGLGVGCLSHIAVKDDFNAGSLIPLPLRGRKMHRHFYLIRHKETQLSDALQHWISICNEDNTTS